MLKKILIVLVIIASVALLGYGIYRYTVDINESRNDENFLAKVNESINKKEEKEIVITGDSVVIKSGIIENETLIDEFIKKAVETNLEEERLTIYQDKNKIELVYTPGEYATALKAGDEEKQKELLDLVNQDPSPRIQRQVYGQLSRYVNGEITHSFGLHTVSIERVARYNQVRIQFELKNCDYAGSLLICEYKLEDAEYKYNYVIDFKKRDDLEVKDIYDDKFYHVKTLGGDVDILVDGDKTYDLQSGLEEGVYTMTDISSECSGDYSWGFKEKGFSSYYHHRNEENVNDVPLEEQYQKEDFYSEYYYKDYTVLYIVKGLDHTMVIGPKGKLYDTYIRSLEG